MSCDLLTFKDLIILRISLLSNLIKVSLAAGNFVLLLFTKEYTEKQKKY